MTDTDKRITELNRVINDREMATVGNWSMAKVVTDSFSEYNSTVATDQHVESVERSDSYRTLWRHSEDCATHSRHNDESSRSETRHSDGKTWLSVSKHSPSGKYRVVVYMGSNETDSVGPGWTCGINAYCDSPYEAVDWAETYMRVNDSMSHLYDD
jgi:hypothetical protein